MGSISSPNSLSGDKILVFLPADPDQSWISATEAKYPGLEIRWHKFNLAEGFKSPDSLGADVWDGVTIYFGFMPASAQYMKDVRFVQLPSAGADKWLDNDFYTKKPDVVFSSANGVHP